VADGIFRRELERKLDERRKAKAKMEAEWQNPKQKSGEPFIINFEEIN